MITCSKAGPGELHHGLLINRAGIPTRERSRDGSFSDSAVFFIRVSGAETDPFLTVLFLTSDAASD